MITAIEVLNESGINGMTIREIAKCQGVSEAAIYRHYDGKKEIIKEIFWRYSMYDGVIKNTILDNNMSGKKAIIYFCKVYAEYYQNYPEITTIMFSFDIFKYDVLLNEEMESLIKNRYNLLFGFVLEAIEKKEFLYNKDVIVITDSIFSVLFAITFLMESRKL